MVHGIDDCGQSCLDFYDARTRGVVARQSPDGRVFVGSNDGMFYVLNLSNGAKLWEFNAGAPLSASPAIANGRIVIGSQDGRLVLLRVSCSCELTKSPLSPRSGRQHKAWGASPRSRRR